MAKGETLTLVGVLGAWQDRASPAAGGLVRSAWLRHPALGQIGVYLPQAWRRDPPQRWVRATGAIRPLRALALLDDPRAEGDPSWAVLLLAINTVVAVDAFTPQPELAPRTVQLGRGRAVGRGYLAPARHIPELYGWTPHEQPVGSVLAWDRLQGIVTSVARRRYVRYVVSARTEREEAWETSPR